MADHDSDTPGGPPRRVPDPHRGEPAPAPDAHTRAGEDADMVRPDQQEEIGPVEGLFHTAAVEAKGEITDDPDVEAEAERLGVEGEGVESAQIFGLMLATVVTLGLAVLGVFWLVAIYVDDQTVQREAVTLYPELREVQRVAAEMQQYSRTDSLYRIPIGAAMSQVATAYYAQQGGDAVPAPDHFNTVYLNATRESGVPLWEEYGQDATGSEAPGGGPEAVRPAGAQTPAGGSTQPGGTVPQTEAVPPAVEGEAGATQAPAEDNEPDGL